MLNRLARHLDANVEIKSSQGDRRWLPYRFFLRMQSYPRVTQIFPSNEKA